MESGGFERGRELYRGGVATIYEVGAQGSAPPGGLAAKVLEEPEFWTDRQRQARRRAFAARVRAQKAVSASSAHWARVVVDGGEVEPFYVTRHYARSAADLCAVCAPRVDDVALRRIVSGVIRGLVDLREVSGRAHGRLVPSNVLLDSPRPRRARVVLTDPAPDAEGQAGRRNHDDDIRAIGQLLCGLVLHRSGRHQNDTGVIGPSQEWEELGRRGEAWRSFCNRLLGQGEPFRTLEEVAAAVPPPARMLVPVAAAVVCLVVLLVGWVGVRHAYPAEAAFSLRDWKELCQRYEKLGDIDNVPKGEKDSLLALGIHLDDLNAHAPWVLEEDAIRRDLTIIANNPAKAKKKPDRINRGLKLLKELEWIPAEAERRSKKLLQECNAAEIGDEALRPEARPYLIRLAGQGGGTEGKTVEWMRSVLQGEERVRAATSQLKQVSEALRSLRRNNDPLERALETKARSLLASKDPKAGDLADLARNSAAIPNLLDATRADVKGFEEAWSSVSTSGLTRFDEMFPAWLALTREYTYDNDHPLHHNRWIGRLDPLEEMAGLLGLGAVLDGVDGIRRQIKLPDEKVRRKDVPPLEPVAVAAEKKLKELTDEVSRSRATLAAGETVLDLLARGGIAPNFGADPLNAAWKEQARLLAAAQSTLDEKKKKSILDLTRRFYKVGGFVAGIERDHPLNSAKWGKELERRAAIVRDGLLAGFMRPQETDSTTNVLFDAAKAQLQPYVKWRRDAALAAGAADRMDQLLSALYFLDSPFDGAQSIGDAFDAWEAQVKTLGLKELFTDGTIATVKALREAENAQGADLERYAGDTRAVVSLFAWSRLKSLPLDREWKLEERLTGLIDASTDARRKAYLQELLKSERLERVRQVLQYAAIAAPGALDVADRMVQTAGMIDGLDAVSRYNLELFRFKRWAEGSPRDQVEELAVWIERLHAPSKDFDAKTAAVTGPGLEELRKLHERMARLKGGRRFAGPPADAWGPVPANNGQSVRYAPRNAALPAMEFWALGDDSDSFMCSTVVSIELFEAIVALKDVDRGRNPLRDRAGGEIKFWPNGPCAVKFAGGRWVRNDRWWEKGNARMGADDILLKDGNNERPSEQHPMQLVPAALAQEVAGVIGCRLPTIDEWRAALAKESGEQPAGKFKWNLRDRNWKQFHDAWARLNTSAPAFATRFEPFKFDTFIRAQRGATEVWAPSATNGLAGNGVYDDGHVFFEPVAPGAARGNVGRYFHHLVGNVSHLVTRTAGGQDFYVIGPSALSPPEPGGVLNCPELALKPEQLNQGWVDVGFRVVFDAADRLPVRLARVAEEAQYVSVAP